MVKVKSREQRNVTIGVVGITSLVVAVIVSVWNSVGMASTPSSLLLTTSDTGKVPPDKQSAKIVKEESLSSSASANTGAGAGAAVPSFLELAQKHGTDKVRGSLTYDACMADPSKCPRRQAYNDMCKVTGHFYDRIYQQWLEPLIHNSAEPAWQFLEIGYYRGNGFDAYTEFLPEAVEKHSLEISCLEEGPMDEGKWPWGNFAEKNKNYQALRDTHRLHCGDAATYQFLHDTWTKHMKRPDAPPLKVVVEDASHLSKHMAASVFFWFPRIEPGGILVVEDIESQTPANKFRTDFLPQLMMDLHYCGLDDKADAGNTVCFPTLQPLLKAIHCQLHICVLERNEKPAVEYDQVQSMSPPNALDLMACRNKKKA
eukprot:scaffold34617_cov159-Amphora_coffeaeformis.AAC.1